MCLSQSDVEVCCIQNGSGDRRVWGFKEWRKMGTQKTWAPGESTIYYIELSRKAGQWYELISTGQSIGRATVGSPTTTHTHHQQPHMAPRKALLSSQHHQPHPSGGIGGLCHFPMGLGLKFLLSWTLECMHHIQAFKKRLKNVYVPE